MIMPPPLVRIYDALRALNAGWGVDVGRPSGPGWIRGRELANASAGPLNDLLVRIGERSRTADKRTVAAGFTLRFGWASAMAIAPYLEFACVPDVSLENVSLKFTASTFFERTSIHEPRGTMVAGGARAADESIRVVESGSALLRTLRDELVSQAEPVVAGLYDWSGFAPRGSWGMLTSSWAAHFTSLGGDQDDQRTILPALQDFFAGADVVSELRPRFHAVSWNGVTHVYQRRASCCRWYLLPDGELCTSCPLVSQEERVARNLASMQKQLAGRPEARGHS
jgi:hypothetical protein